MAEERFQLPRLDWHDAEGRIYKDALIENFNAIEEKILYLQEHLTVKIEEPDWTEIHIPTIDNIEEAEDNQVLNLKSFVDALNIKNFPLKCEFNGKTCVKLTYFNDSYNLITLTNQLVSNVSSDLPLVYLNPSTRSLYATNTNVEGDLLIGVYTNGNIYAINDTLKMCDIDLLSILYKMPVETGNVGHGYRNSQLKMHKAVRQDSYAGWTCVNLHNVGSGTDIQLQTVDIGREGGKSREEYKE